MLSRPSTERECLGTVRKVGCKRAGVRRVKHGAWTWHPDYRDHHAVATTVKGPVVFERLTARSSGPGALSGVRLLASMRFRWSGLQPSANCLDTSPGLLCSSPSW